MSLEQAEEVGALFWSLPIQLDPAPNPAVMSDIQKIAAEHRLTAYDAAYLEMAIRKSAFLKSFDQDLLNLQSRFSFIQ